MLAVMLGSRGELCSLRWTDVDFEHGELIDSGVISRPAADRPGPDQELHRAGSRSARPRWSCCAPTGSIRPRSLSPRACRSRPTPTSSAISPTAQAHPSRWRLHRFAKLAQRLGVRCRLHDLRHFMVTHPVDAGVDVRTVAGRAGHVDGGRTTSAPTRTSSTRRTATRLSCWKGCHLPEAARRPEGSSVEPDTLPAWAEEHAATLADLDVR